MFHKAKGSSNPKLRGFFDRRQRSSGSSEILPDAKGLTPQVHQPAILVEGSLILDADDSVLVKIDPASHGHRRAAIKKTGFYPSSGRPTNPSSRLIGRAKSSDANPTVVAIAPPLVRTETSTEQSPRGRRLSNPLGGNRSANTILRPWQRSSYEEGGSRYRPTNHPPRPSPTPNRPRGPVSTSTPRTPTSRNRPTTPTQHGSPSKTTLPSTSAERKKAHKRDSIPTMHRVISLEVDSNSPPLDAPAGSSSISDNKRAQHRLTPQRKLVSQSPRRPGTTPHRPHSHPSHQSNHAAPDDDSHQHEKPHDVHQHNTQTVDHSPSPDPAGFQSGLSADAPTPPTPITSSSAVSMDFVPEAEHVEVAPRRMTLPEHVAEEEASRRQSLSILTALRSAPVVDDESPNQAQSSEVVEASPETIEQEEVIAVDKTRHTMPERESVDAEPGEDLPSEPGEGSARSSPKHSRSLWAILRRPSKPNNQRAQVVARRESSESLPSHAPVPSLKLDPTPQAPPVTVSARLRRQEQEMKLEGKLKDLSNNLSSLHTSLTPHAIDTPKRGPSQDTLHSLTFLKNLRESTEDTPELPEPISSQPSKKKILRFNIFSERRSPSGVVVVEAREKSFQDEDDANIDINVDGQSESESSSDEEPTPRSSAPPKSVLGITLNTSLLGVGRQLTRNASSSSVSSLNLGVAKGMVFEETNEGATEVDYIQEAARLCENLKRSKLSTNQQNRVPHIP